MPVCLLSGGLETSTIGSEAVFNSISFVMNLPPSTIPLTMLAGIEVGELTPDGLELLSTLFDFIGDRDDMTSMEYDGVPLDWVETPCSDYGASINSTDSACVNGTGPGNYADLCSFTCTYGFCDSPCTCK